MRSALVLALLAGCYQPAYEDCQITCANNACPSGLTCVAGMCRTTTGPCGGGGGSADASQPGTWAYRKRVLIPPVADVVRDFPLLVNHVDPDLASRARVDGGDIKFTTIDGIKLAHELESYDKGTGRVIAWVRVPVVQTTSTELYMYYGNQLAATQADPAGVWDSSYSGVWHLSDPASDTVQDSTAANLDGAKGNTNAPASFPAGQIAGSLSYASTGQDLFGLPSGSSLDSQQTTFEAWLRRDVSTTNVFRRLLEYPVTFATSITIGFPEDGVVDPTVSSQSLFVNVRSAGTSLMVQSEQGSLSSNNWYHIAVTVDGNVPQIYLNGSLRQLTSVGFNMPHENSLVSIGGRFSATGGTTDGVSGLLDEVRISKVVRSAAYVALSYLSQSKPDFLTFGPAETLP